MDAEQPNKRSAGDEKRAHKNTRHRELYRVNMAIEKNALSLQQQLTDQMLESCPLQITTPTISPEIMMPSEYWSSVADTRNTCSAPKAVAELTVLPVFPASTKGNPPSIYEKGSTSGSCKDKESTAKTVITQGHKTLALNIKLRSDYVPLKKVSNCKFCFAKKFQYESPGFCCGTGTIKIISHRLPTRLHDLYLRNDEKSRHFRTYIRTYNNLFAFTSLGVNYDADLARRNRGIYTFRVQGRMYHRIDNLYPSGNKAKNLQLYFYDPENELTNRMACSDKVNESIVQELMDILRINPYSFFVRSLIHIPQLHNFHIALKCDSGLDQRLYNLPTSSEIAAIWVEENDNTLIHAPHIQIYTHTNKTQIVNYYYGCYDALQYPLLFPHGQNGWHCGIKKISRPKNVSRRYIGDCEELSSIKNHCSLDSYLDMEAQTLEKGKRKRDTVSVRKYYCYKIQMRDDDEDEILHTGRLFQQYSVDEYIKLESQRLDFASFNQDLFRMEVLQGLLDILRLGRTRCI